MSDPIAGPSDLSNMLGGQSIARDDVAEFLIGLAQGLAEDIVSPLPSSARAVVLSAAARAYVNPDGLSTETIGPYSVQHGGAGVFLTSGEIRALRRAAGQGGAFTIDPTPAGASPVQLSDWLAARDLASTPADAPDADGIGGVV